MKREASQTSASVLEGGTDDDALASADEWRGIRRKKISCRRRCITLWMVIKKAYRTRKADRKGKKEKKKSFGVLILRARPPPTFNAEREPS